MGGAIHLIAGLCRCIWAIFRTYWAGGGPNGKFATLGFFFSHLWFEDLLLAEEVNNSEGLPASKGPPWVWYGWKRISIQGKVGMER